MALTTEELLLLTNLMYTYEAENPAQHLHDGVTVETFISTLDPEACSGDYTTSEDWSDIVSAIRSDSKLMQMEIVATDNDFPGGGFNAVFVDRESHEAVVAFKGTEGDGEWRDNFAGGNLADTPCQKGALDWYQKKYEECGLAEYDVTVTGHSKGGNKAKYVTLMNPDNTVNRCVSFDGQGFSDKFFEDPEHAKLIAQRQHLIQNHNVNGDYVNILLNDVGERYYYKGQNLGNANNAFIERHCPNSYFSVDSNGKMIMIPTEQDPLMAQADELFNGMLRAMPDDARRDAMLGMVGELVIGALNEESADYFTTILYSPENRENLGFFVAYLAAYVQADPEFRQQINDILNDLGMQDMIPIIDKALKFYDIFKDLPTWVIGLGAAGVSWYLKTFKNIEIPSELIQAVLMANVSIEDGSDRSVGVSLKDIHLKISSEALSQAVGELATCAGLLSDIEAQLDGIRTDGVITLLFGLSIRSEKTRVRAERNDLEKLKNALTEIGDLYVNVENGLIGRLG